MVHLRRRKGLDPWCSRGVAISALEGLPLDRYNRREKEIPLLFKPLVPRLVLLHLNIISNCQFSKYFDSPVLETCCL